MMERLDKLTDTQRRRRWEPPTLKPIGTISQLVQSGGGKASTMPFDSGDPPFKPPGQG
jgi:hypothetical protein